MYPVCISLSPSPLHFLPSMCMHGFISLFLSLLVLHPISPSPSFPSLSIPESNRPTPIPLFTPHQRPKMDSLPGPGMVFEKFCSHAATYANTHHTRDRTVYAYVHWSLSARAPAYTSTQPYLTGITMIDTRVPLFSFLSSPPPLSLFSRSTPDLFRSFCNWLAVSQNSLVLPRTRTPEFDV